MVPNRPSMLRSWEWESPLHLASPKSEICNRAQAGGSAGCGAPRGVRPGPSPGAPGSSAAFPHRYPGAPAGDGPPRTGETPGRGLGQAGYAPRASWTGGRVAASALKGTALRKPCEVSELAPRAASAPPGTFCDQRALAGACTKHRDPEAGLIRISPCRAPGPLRPHAPPRLLRAKASRQLPDARSGGSGVARTPGGHQLLLQAPRPEAPEALCVGRGQARAFGGPGPTEETAPLLSCEA